MTSLVKTSPALKGQRPTTLLRHACTFWIPGMRQGSDSESFARTNALTTTRRPGAAASCHPPGVDPDRSPGTRTLRQTVRSGTAVGSCAPCSQGRSDRRVTCRCQEGRPGRCSCWSPSAGHRRTEKAGSEMRSRRILPPCTRHACSRSRKKIRRPSSIGVPAVACRRRVAHREILQSGLPPVGQSAVLPSLPIDESRKGGLRQPAVRRGAT